MIQPKKTTQLEVKNAWLLDTNVVVELQHTLHGLAPGTIVQAANGHQWKLKSRVMFSHVQHQKKFPNEAVTIFHPLFSSEKKQEKSVIQIINQENKGVFQYIMEPEIEYTLPASGETLWLIAL